MSNDIESKNAGWLLHVEFFVILITILGFTYNMNSMNAATNARIDQVITTSNAKFDQFMFEWKQESKDFHESMKDFHGRLCAIEERNKGK